ncbi:MAG: glycoside hydrolase family 9 protein [Acidobacteriaceae bacterium]|nr:glycoside hydrolase family 9 protein [Acidobacteriaceae bacterium]
MPRRFLLLASAGLVFFAAFLGVFSAAAAPTTAIKVDQVGYLPSAKKIAMVVAGTNPESFTIRRAGDNSVAFQGKLHSPVFDPDSGDRVQAADFTGLSETGKFYVDVPAIGRSWSFAIAPDVFSRVYYLAMRSYYGQRCGTAVDLGPEFPGYKHAACHLEGGYDPSSGKTGSHVSKYGWHDAGDYGRYVVNSGISTGTLLWTWELYGDGLRDISLHLPESGNRVPDILNEIRWNLEWMLTMQDGDGGVWHKQTSTHFCEFIMPEQDTLVSYVIGTGNSPFKSSCATADFAAVMAIAGRAYRPFDAAFAEKCLNAAENAWNWLEKNPKVLFRNPPGITTGAYGDRDCEDERLWAAAELLRTTGQPIYSHCFLTHYHQFLHTVRPDEPASWPMVAPLALWTYVLGNGADAQAAAAIRESSLRAADGITQRINADAYHISLITHDYIWGSNGVIANYAMQLLIADRFQSHPEYVAAASEDLHYILGRNTFSLSWVTQVGEHAFLHPHHRPSAALGLPAPWPGLMAGGPNRGRQDSLMKSMLPQDVPPAKAYIDVTGAYSCNEVAINWNAPLVFVLAAMLPH